MSKPRTAVRMYFGELTLIVETSEAQSPEAVETMINRSVRQFIIMNDALEAGVMVDEDAEILAAYDTDDE